MSFQSYGILVKRYWSGQPLNAELWLLLTEASSPLPLPLPEADDGDDMDSKSLFAPLTLHRLESLVTDMSTSSMVVFHRMILFLCPLGDALVAAG